MAGTRQLSISSMPFWKPKMKEQKEDKELWRCGVKHFTKEVFNTLLSFIFLKKKKKTCFLDL